jgi:hypothetical protein
MKYLIFLLPLVYFLVEKGTDGFRSSRSGAISDETWSAAAPPNLDAILNQRFSYLASGGQAWVFVSEDGNYVLKFFKRHKRRQKIKEDMASCKLAYDKLKEESGLIYLHLAPSCEKIAAVVDKLHLPHRIDLGKTAFLIQKRAAPLYDTLRSFMEKGDMERAKAALADIRRLIYARAQKGIKDEDARLHCNLGLIGTEAILLDVGRLRDAPARKENAAKDFHQSTAKLHLWLKENYPELCESLSS